MDNENVHVKPGKDNFKDNKSSELFDLNDSIDLYDSIHEAQDLSHVDLANTTTK